MDQTQPAETEREKVEQPATEAANQSSTASQNSQTAAASAGANGAATSSQQPAVESAEASPAEGDLQTQLNEALSKANEYLDGWQRSRAEFANYRKRIDKEREELYQTATVDALKRLLPVIDDFDRAISNLPADKAEDAVIKGFSQIHRKLSTLLDGAGIKVINPVGEEFNPAFHEAIGQDDNSEVASGHVSVVLQKGYMHGDKVLRPAMVRVAS